MKFIFFLIFLVFLSLSTCQECNPQDCQSKCCIAGVCEADDLRCQFVPNYEFNYLINTLIALVSFIIGEIKNIIYLLLNFF